jgi:hypothetical protein
VAGTPLFGALVPNGDRRIATAWLFSRKGAAPATAIFATFNVLPSRQLSLELAAEQETA